MEVKQMTKQIEVESSVDFSSNIAFTITTHNWIILGEDHRKTKPFKVEQVTATLYHNSNGKKKSQDWEIEPDVSVTGRWANASGSKWNTRRYYWNWRGGSDRMVFADLPAVVKDEIFKVVTNRLRDSVIELTASYKMLVANNGFKAATLTNTTDPEVDEDNPFMATVNLAKGSLVASKWENHDVSQWPIARRELGLPKPPRKKRTKKVV
jgi:hypothetical protein